jgi:hypothetical protein
LAGAQTQGDTNNFMSAWSFLYRAYWEGAAEANIMRGTSTTMQQNYTDGSLLVATAN